MTYRSWWQTVAAVMVGALLALIIRYVVLKAMSVLVLFGLGLLVAWVMDPLLDRLQRARWPRWAAVWVVTLGFLVVVAIGGILIVPGIVAQVQDAAANWQEYSTQADRIYQVWRARLEAYALEHLPTYDVMPFLDVKVQQGQQWISNQIPLALQWLSAQLITSISLVGLFGILLLISFHFMMVIDPLREQVRKMLPASADCEVDTLGLQINAMLGQYLRGVVVISILVGISATIVLWVLGLFFGTKYALILGLVTGVTYMIPYIGPLISAVSAAFFGYVTVQVGSPWVSSLAALLGMYAVNQVFDMAVTPRVVGQRVGLHPLLVLFSVMAGFSLFGIWGMIIATPAAASIKIILARWLPIKSIDYTVPCPKRRLDIDVPASLDMLAKSIVKLGRDLETAMNRQTAEASSEQPELPSEKPEEGGGKAEE